LNAFYSWLDRLLTWFLIALVVLMVFSITAEIVLNAIIQPSVSFLMATQDHQDDSTSFAFLQGVMNGVAKASSPVNTASQTLLVWIGILGSSLALRYRAHLGVDALVRLYPPKIRLILDYVSTVLVGLFSLAVLLAGGYMVCERAFSLGSKMPGFEAFNRGWFYLVLVITGVLNLLYCVYHLMHPKPVSGVDAEGGE
jgi:TRAP-type C4-dicarboxylate transport system permease small subunit